MEPPWEGGGGGVCINGPGNMPKMSATPKYGKTRGSPMILKLAMQHRGLKLYKLCIRDGPFEFLGGGGEEGGWVIFGETVFFSAAGKPEYFFFDRLKDRIFFFGQSESSFFFLDYHMNHYQSLIRTCILNFSFINLV